MAHDFAKQRAVRAKTAGKPAASPWLWLASGFVLGILTSFLVYLATLSPHPRQEPLEASNKVVAPRKSPATPAQKPEFDFYTLLPESEIIVADRSTDAASKGVSVPEPTPPSVLLLQAGSFRQIADADRRRAEILLLGLDASVETVTVNGSETWHRVHVGPFASAEALGQARRALMEQQIDALEISKRA